MKVKRHLLTESFELHKTLNPRIWDSNGYLRPEVDEKLHAIIDQFMLEMADNDVPVIPVDARIVGSNASYNYSKQSDLDIHLVVNSEAIPCSLDIINLLYLYFKSYFNEKYDISIHGVNVELYIEDVNAVTVSNGIYSLFENKWLKTPEPIEDPRIDITDTFEKYEEEYEDILASRDSDKAMQFINSLYLLRKDSIKGCGELGEGNLLFKEFRDRGYIQNLKDMVNSNKAKELSLEGLQESFSLSEAVYGSQKWSNLTDEERQRCLDADPTYNGKEDSAGKYSEWILKIYSDFKKEHPDGMFRFSHCKDVLRQFMRDKQRIDPSKRDINQFKSLEELDAFENNPQNFVRVIADIEMPKEASDLKKVFENNRCIIWTPLTHKASMRVASEPKTKWCTAYPNPSNYDSYTQDGPLFILIMKDDPSEMYQFHFETDAAMDKYDNPVQWEDFPELKSEEVQKEREDFFKAEDEKICRSIERGLAGHITTNSVSGAATIYDSYIEKLHNARLATEYQEKVYNEYILPGINKYTERGFENLPFDDLKEVYHIIGHIHAEDEKERYSSDLDEAILNNFYNELSSISSISAHNTRTLHYLSNNVKIDLIIPDNITAIECEAFDKSSYLRSVVIPDSVTDIESYAFYNSSIESVILGNGLDVIQANAFQSCIHLTSVELGSGLTAINSYAFAGCKALESITIPDSVRNIWAMAFSKCPSLKNVHLPTSLKILSWGAFDTCRNLESIEIPEGAAIIENTAFGSCDSLKSIYLPASIERIGYRAFKNCTALKDIYYGGSEEDASRIIINSDNSELKKAVWHYNCKSNMPE